MFRDNHNRASRTVGLALRQRRALAVAVAAAAATCLGASAQSTGTYFTQTSKVSLVEGTSAATSDIFVGATRVAVEGENGGASFENFAVLDFNASALNVPSFNLITGLNSDTMTLDLIDRSPLDNFAVSGQINFFLATNTGSLTGDYFMGSGGSNAIGSQLGGISSLGSVNYVAGTSSGRDDSISLTFSTNQASYILSQLQNGGDIRLLATPNSATVEANWQGSGAGTNAPKLSFNLQTAPAPATDALIQVGASSDSVTNATKALTIPTIDRLYSSGSVTNVVTLSNMGTAAGSFKFLSNTNGASGTLIGTNIASVPGSVSGVSGSVNINVTLSNTFAAGKISTASPGTASLMIQDSSNPGDTINASVNFTVNHSITARFVDNQGELSTPVNFGSVLVGATGSSTVTFDTENTGVPNLGSNTLTILMLPGTTTISGTNGNIFNTASNKGTLAMAADPSGSNGNTVFMTGLETATRNATFTPLLGGNYANSGTTIGFVTVPVQYDDPGLVGAPTAPTAGRVNITGTFYQAASITASGSGIGTLTLSNASATANLIGTGTNAKNIGLRAAAAIVSTNQAGQSGFLVTGFPTDGSGTIAAGASLAGNASFTPASTPLNGTYTGSFSIGMQHADQTIVGTAPNDLPTKTFSLSANVTGFSGTGSANILADGNYGGYYINRGSGANTTVSFIGGTASTNTNLTVSKWDDAGAGLPGGAVSDRSTVTGTGTDTYVIQMNYNPGVVTNINSLAIGYNNGTNFVSPSFAGAGATQAESVGAYDNSSIVGHFGLNTNTATAWAVVNSQGQYAVVSRLSGDANFDGRVDISDLDIVLNNYLKTPNATWSQGNFHGTSTGGFADINSLDDVLNSYLKNFATPSMATPSGAVAKAANSSIGSGGATSAPGTIELDVNTLTGDVKLNANNVDIATLQVASGNGNGDSLLPNNWQDLANAYGVPHWTDAAFASNGLAEFDSNFSTRGDFTAINGIIDYGDIYNPADPMDLSFTYGLVVMNGTNESIITTPGLVVATPEPTAISLLGLGGAALLKRRQRKGRATAC